MTETQKVFSLKKPVVIADYREEKVIEELEKFSDIKVVKMPLPIADFICSEEIGIERKTWKDFASSIVDGRVFEQSKELSNSFAKPIVIIEGYEEVGLSENAMLAAEATLVAVFGITIVYTRNIAETARLIYWIAKKTQTSGSGVGIKLKKKASNLKEAQERIVASLPGVSTVLSKRLLERFGSVEAVFKASEHELMKVKGIGEKLAKRIKKVLTEKYY